MITYNLQRMFRLRSIGKPFTFLRQNGFTYAIAHRLASGKFKGMNNQHLYKLCQLLYCTPNDLMDYTPGNDPEDHPLHTLIKDNPTHNYTSEMRKMSLEKLKKLDQFLTDLKNDDI
ncbi:MAG: hypothetical protein A2W91_19855 [Bacteroidetes bacterium GWF2_38_335]|nr:MAG: hypothetical protein A2W91_19855 [Bacteroidetes bacterium GWF2_38_335]OFY82022.1 MAG: hypothetical protein A2281_10065 [Bacteroidetes bacterium RIFOXYA12_FULL_38_20]HBS86474.1 hypothetical protein [Bacteroidales bacterium]